MRLLSICLALGVGGALDGTAQEEKSRDAQVFKNGLCEVRVYVTGIEERPVDLTQMSATLVLKPADGSRSTSVKMTRVDGRNVDRPRKDRIEGIGPHGGEVKTVGIYEVELVLLHSPVSKADPANPVKPEPAKEEANPLLDGAPYFTATYNKMIYWCGAKGHETSFGAGECGPCKQPRTARRNKCTADVNLQIGNQSQIAAGFVLAAYGYTKFGWDSVDFHLMEVADALQTDDFNTARQHAAHLKRIVDRCGSAEMKKDLLMEVDRLDSALLAGRKEDATKSIESIRRMIEPLKDPRENEHRHKGEESPEKK